MGSKVFEAMFKPHFKEGTQLADAATRPVHIDLPEDHPEAMVDLCKVMHLQNSFIDPNKSETPERILLVSLASDKYQCSAAMQLAAFCWLETCLPADEESRRRLFAAAYYFRDARAFRSTGREILLHNCSTYKRGSNPHLDGALSKLLATC